ncbi:DUF4349 domain-containing protein [Candidatus Woesearchaeota archaeon]|nr:DUF4349 domain-containing protein [Candidatus Woesearchaeota archaeon]
MPIKSQLSKIKENWLLLVIVLIVVAFLNFGNTASFGGISSLAEGIGFEKMAAQDAAYSRGYGIIPSPSYGDFAPDVTDRKITKSSSITIETETGSFQDAESKLKSIVKSTNSYLLNENVNKYDSGWKTYYSGTYQIKVDSRKYNDIISQLKGTGEVKSFSENAEDITGSYKNLEIELDAEKQRLARYQEMYKEAILTADKLQISDRIFDQERTIKYLEDSIKNMDKQVDYSTIYATLNEKQSEYANIIFVKFSDLVRSLVESINGLLTLIFVVAPYAVAAAILWFIVRLFRKGKGKK